MGILMTRTRAMALGLRPSKKKQFATEVDEVITSAAEKVAKERRTVGESTYSLLKTGEEADNLLEVLQSAAKRGRKKDLTPEEQDFLERRRGAVVKESDEEVEIEFFLHPDELDERWKAVQALARVTEARKA